jgi:hypothetical protein
MQELITQVVVVRQELAEMMAAAGGELRVGFYTRQSAMDDLPVRLAETAAAFERYPFLHGLFPFTDEAWSVIHAFRQAPAAVPELPADERGRPPLMHRKTQLVATAELLAALARAEGMAQALAALLREEREVTARPVESGPLIAQSRTRASLQLIELYRALPAELREATLAYFMTGSLNKDVRSMALDGEALAVVAGAWALQAYLDFVLLSGAVTWVDTIEEADALLPPYSRLQRLIGRLLYRVL